MKSEPLLRDASLTDLNEILEIYNDVVTSTTAIYEDKTRSLDQQNVWFHTKVKSGFPVIVAVIDSRVVGFGTFGAFRPWSCYSTTVEHGLHVAKDYRGLGVGSLILSKLIDLARERGTHTMIAGIDSENLGSINLHERFGFKEVGRLPQVARKFSKWLDLVFMQLLLEANKAKDSNPI